MITEDLQLEQMVLCGVLSPPNNFALVAPILKTECFTLTIHQKIFEAMQSLFKERKEIDMITVSTQMDLGFEGRKAVMEITAGEISWNLTTHSKILFQMYYERKLKAITAKASFGDTSTLTQELLEIEKEWEVFKAQKPFSQMVDEVEKEIDKAILNEHLLSGITTGSWRLDAETGGWQNSDLIIIAGRPGMGKTARCLNFLKAAVNDTRNALFMSFEMSSGQLIKRLLSEGSGIDLSEMNKGKVSPFSRNQITEVASELKKLPIIINDNGRTSIYDISTKCRILKSQNKLDILIVDYLQIIPQGAIKTNSRNDLIGIFTSELKNVAKENQIPVILMAQLNRSGEGKSDARPELHQLRESGNIEQDADFVGFIYRPSYYTKGDQAKETNTAFKEMENGEYLRYSELIIAKHRNGKLGTIKENFDGATQRFY